MEFPDFPALVAVKPAQSAAEAKSTKSLFAKLDANGDGIVDAEELEGAIEQGLLTKEMLMSPSQNGDVFQVKQEWELTSVNAAAAATHSSFRAGKDTFKLEEPQEDYHSPATCPLMLSPASIKRLVWDLTGMALIAYDTLAIPIEIAFEPEDTDFTYSIFWVAIIFWTLDIFLTFVTGYYSGNGEEMRMSRIAVRYAKTWMMFDIVVVGADWAGVVLRSQSTTGLGMARIARIMRVLRTIRLLRLAKLQRVTEIIIDSIVSEYTHICLNMLKIVLLVLVLNHVVACAWYLVGRASTHEGSSWTLKGHFDQQDSLLYRYLTSLHWSLTQFTPASMEVFPTNIYERGFAVCVLMFALLVFSSFVSSITASMTQLRHMRVSFDKNVSLLRRYLRTKEVPMDLYLRILKHVQHQLILRQQEIQESDVTCLRLLSKPLQEELVHHYLTPSLSQHPLFRIYDMVSPSASLAVSNHAISKHSLSANDTIFTSGTHDDRMLFTEHGSLRYILSRSTFTRRHSSNGVEYVTPDQWCCEAALWTRWIHVGSMFAAEFSRILTVDAKKFVEIAKADGRVKAGTGRYARRFVENLKEQFENGNLTDLTNEGSVDTQALVNKAFQSEMAELMRANSTVIEDPRNIVNSVTHGIVVVSKFIQGSTPQ